MVLEQLEITKPDKNQQMNLILHSLLCLELMPKCSHTRLNLHKTSRSTRTFF